MCLPLNRREFLSAMGCLAVSSGPASGQSLPSSPLTPTNQIAFGADYYAEDWPVERLAIDAELMARAGFNTVRLIDTNWQRLEPAEGRYSFAWLDHALAVMRPHGIRAILCTSSYAPPAWLVEKVADIHLVDEQGHRYPAGGMGFLCLNHPVYRQYVAKLVTALALHFGQHPDVVGWQIDNEFGYWGEQCYDPRYCVPAFRRYLQAKFGTLTELNQRLHTVSYGHEYTAWEQIPLRITIHDEGDALQVPLVLEAKRFFSWNMVQFMTFQAKLLRTHTRHQFITHNGPKPTNNLFEFARPLDFLAEDSYPMTGQFTRSASFTDLMRGANHGRTFQVLEMRSGTFGSYTSNDATPPPGLARLFAWQTIAHGADGVLFFRWRRNNAGSEPYWQGLLSSEGTPAPPYAEVARMGQELRQHGAGLAQAVSPARVAGVVSFDSYWAIQIGHKEFPYFETITAWTQAFRRLRMNVDMVEPLADLHAYDIVFAPALYLVDARIAAWLEAFVSRGGTLVLGPRAGFANEDYVSRQTAPGLLEPLAQVRVDNFTLLTRGSQAPASGVYRPSGNNGVQGSGDWPGTFAASVWADLLTPTGARPLYTYTEDFFAGKPAITVADHGKGRTIYVGTLLDETFYIGFVERVCQWAGVPCGPALPDSVDYCVRTKGGRRFTFLLNFAAQTTVVTFAGTRYDLLSGKPFTGSVPIPAFDLCILTDDAGA